jgi:hypothetical protein
VAREQVKKDFGVAGIILSPRGAKGAARARHGLGMDGKEDETGILD